MGYTPKRKPKKRLGDMVVQKAGTGKRARTFLKPRKKPHRKSLKPMGRLRTAEKGKARKPRGKR